MSTFADWLDGKLDLARLEDVAQCLFGDESPCAAEIKNWLARKDAADLRRLEQRLEAKGQGLAEDHALNRDEIVGRVRGLRCVLVACRVWSKIGNCHELVGRLAKDAPPDDRLRPLLKLLRQAAAAFENAYPTAEELPGWQSAVDAADPDATDAARAVEAVFHLLAVDAEFGVGKPNRGLYMARDLFRRVMDCQVEGAKTAHTAVLLRRTDHDQSQYGTVLWLTVELLDGDGAGFAPDPLALGLTSINLDDDTENFLAAMDRAWRMSQVEARGYRGRWRLTHKCPLPGALAERKEIGPNDQVALPNLSGRSAECAALAAILAASGLVPYGDPDHHLSPLDKPLRNADYPPLKMVPSVAVTASLVEDEQNEDQRPTEIKLGRVHDVDKKLRGAMRYKLDDGRETLFDTVLISPDDKENAREVREETERAQRQATEAREPYEGVYIVDVTSVGDALNLLLETNRWLKDWHATQRSAWEDRWAGDTGKLDQMIAGQELAENG